MKKTLALLLAALMLVVAIPAGAITLDTPETAAEVPAEAEDAALSSLTEIVPGNNWIINADGRAAYNNMVLSFDGHADASYWRTHLWHIDQNTDITGGAAVDTGTSQGYAIKLAYSGDPVWKSWGFYLGGHAAAKAIGDRPLFYGFRAKAAEGKNNVYSRIYHPDVSSLRPDGVFTALYGADDYDGNDLHYAADWKYYGFKAVSTGGSITGNFLDQLYFSGETELYLDDLVLTPYYKFTYMVDGSEYDAVYVCPVDENGAFLTTANAFQVAAPSVEGKNFLGWSTVDGGDASADVALANADVTLYAVFGDAVEESAVVIPGSNWAFASLYNNQKEDGTWTPDGTVGDPAYFNKVYDFDNNVFANGWISIVGSTNYLADTGDSARGNALVYTAGGNYATKYFYPQGYSDGSVNKVIIDRPLYYGYREKVSAAGNTYANYGATGEGNFLIRTASGADNKFRIAAVHGPALNAGLNLMYKASWTYHGFRIDIPAGGFYQFKDLGYIPTGTTFYMDDVILTPYYKFNYYDKDGNFIGFEYVCPVDENGAFLTTAPAAGAIGAPAVSGAEFAGWSLTKGGKAVKNVPLANADVDLYAAYKVNIVESDIVVPGNNWAFGSVYANTLNTTNYYNKVLDFDTNTYTDAWVSYWRSASHVADSGDSAQGNAVVYTVDVSGNQWDIYQEKWFYPKGWSNAANGDKVVIDRPLYYGYRAKVSKVGDNYGNYDASGVSNWLIQAADETNKYSITELAGASLNQNNNLMFKANWTYHALRIDLAGTSFYCVKDLTHIADGDTLYMDDVVLTPYYKFVYLDENGEEIDTAFVAPVDLTTGTFLASVDPTAQGVTAPEKEDLAFLGWSLTADGAPLTAVPLANADVTLYPVYGLPAAPVSTNQFSLRTTGNPGMRYTAFVSETAAENADEYGFLVADAASIGDGANLVFPAGFDSSLLDGVTGKTTVNVGGADVNVLYANSFNAANGIARQSIMTYEGENGFRINAVLINIAEEKYHTAFTVRPYVRVGSIYAYGAPMTKDLYTLASELKAAGDVSSYVKTILGE